MPSKRKERKVAGDILGICLDDGTVRKHHGSIELGHLKAFVDEEVKQSRPSEPQQFQLLQGLIALFSKPNRN